MKNEKVKKVIIGGDPGGFELKNAVRDHLIEEGYDVTDVDPQSPDLFQDVAVKVAQGVQSGTLTGASPSAVRVWVSALSAINIAVFMRLCAKAFIRREGQNR